MNADRWKVIKGLFQRTIRLPSDEWSAHLDRLAAGDDALRKEVASLLAEHEPVQLTLLTEPSSRDVTLQLSRVRPLANDVDLLLEPKAPTDA